MDILLSAVSDELETNMCAGGTGGAGGTVIDQVGLLRVP